MNPLRIDMEVEIERPVAEVFAAWSTAEALASWFAPMAVEPPEVSMEFAVEGRYSIVMRLGEDVVHTTNGVFREIEPGRKIVMTWLCDAFADPESVVTVRFEPTDRGTAVRLTHERFVSAETCENHRAGWQACLEGLRQYFRG